MIEDELKEAAANTPAESPAPKPKPWAVRYLTLPVLVGIGVIVYLTFFSENSITQRVRYQQMIDSLTVGLRAQQDSLEYYRDLNRRLFNDPELMEQVVREQYNMNRPHEDVYVMTNDNQ